VPGATSIGIDDVRPDASLAGAARKAAGAVRDAISAVAGPSSGGADASAVTNPPVADGAAEQAAPTVSDEPAKPAKPAGRAQAARHRG
jgi:hypothetical protein